MPIAEEWHGHLLEAIRDYGRTRRISSPVVEIVLDDGEQFYLSNASPGPGDDLVTMSAFPAGVRPGQAMREALLENREGELVTPRVVVINPRHVRRIELHDKAPGEGAAPIGFTVSTEPDEADRGER